MIAAVLAVVLVATSGSSAAPAEAAEGAEVVLGFADHLLDGGDPFRAAGEFERYLFLCGACDRAAYAGRRLAEAYRRGGRGREAAARFAAVVAAHPGSPEAPVAARAAAESLEEAGAPGEASDAYRAFAERWPQDASIGEVRERALRTALRARDPARVRAALALPSPAGAGEERAGLLRDLETRAPPRRSPAVAGVMSALLPGSGHAYAGRWRDAAMALAVNALFVSGAVIAWDHEQYALAGALGATEVLWYGGNVVGAVNAADRFNLRAEEAHYRSLERKWVPAAGVSVRF